MYAKPIIEVTNFSSEDIVVNMQISTPSVIIPNHPAEDESED